MERTHFGQHEDDCLGCKLVSLQFQGVDEHSIEVRKRDRQFAVDAAAYRRLKADGIQPRGVDKSAMAEKLASNKAEIELGHSLHPEQVKAYTRTYGKM